MEKHAKIFVAGHRGLVGAAIVRELGQQGYTNLVLRTRQELDLMDTSSVAEFFRVEKPEYVFLSAAKVGGIFSNNTYPAEFIFENLTIQNNIIHNAYLNQVKKLLFLGSSCIYPKLCPQPIKEEYLLSGPLESTNDAYAIAKIAGIKMCQSYNRQYGTNFISAMPTNLYGINDNFHPANSHVLPALLRRMHEAKESAANTVTIWGTGTPKREFLIVDDLANACIFLMQNYNENEIVNIGWGEDVTIRELAETIKEVVGCKAELLFDTSKPDGTPQKLLDVSRMTALGWTAKIRLKEGLQMVYDWFLQQEKVRT